MEQKIWKSRQTTSNFGHINLLDQLTLLKISRAQKILPKHWIITGSCTIIKIIGSIFCALIGNRYQFSWSNSSVISMKKEVILSPSSHGIKAKPHETHNCKSDVSTKIVLFSSYRYEKLNGLKYNLWFIYDQCYKLN